MEKAVEKIDTAEGIEDEDTQISTKIKSVIQHKFEEDKIEIQAENNDEIDVMRVEFWSHKKAGFVLTKTWQDDRKAILHIHKRVLLIIFK